MEGREGPRPATEKETRPVETRIERLFDWASETVDMVMVPPFLPRETRRHLYAARREMLLAARSVIDRSIQRAEEGERRQESTKATKIPVE